VDRKMEKKEEEEEEKRQWRKIEGGID
jgi:hypothetical protein